MTGGLDLRTLLTADKKETRYDRWQRNFAALNPDKVLHPIAMAPLPDGTFKHNGMKAEAIQSTLKELRDAAFFQMMAEEQPVIDQVVKTARTQLESKAGMNDYGRQ
jgi:hypothetical protein